VSHTFDLAAELAAGVQDRHRAWKFIQDFAQAWLTPLRDEDGYSDEELNAAEERLSFKLPAALREAYMLFGKRADLCGTMNFLQPPDRLYMYEDTGLLLYHAENQGAWERYIRPADRYLEDPPTLHSCDLGHKQHVAGAAWTERLSIALLDMVLEESLWNTDALTMLGRVHDKQESARLSLHGELLQAEISEVERRFARLGFPPLPIEESACTPEHRWYAGKDAIVRVNPYFTLTEEQEALSSLWGRPKGRAGLVIRGRTPETVDALYKALPTEWFHWHAG
jgi:hypothetical protein